MRFVQTGVLALGAVMYIVIGIYALTTTKAPDNGNWYLPATIWTIVIWNAMLLAAFIVAIVSAVGLVRSKKTRSLATVAILVKLVALPFFSLNFLLLAFGNLLGLFFIVYAPGLLASAVVGIALTYLTMLSTSVYGWATIVQLRRERVIGIALAVLYSIMLCLFFTDVAAGVMLFGHSRRRPRLTVLVMLIALGVALTALGIVGLLSYPAFDQSYLQKDHDLDGLFRGTDIALIVLGAVAIVVPTLVGVLRRSSLRLEAQQARAVSTSTANG